MDQISIGSGAKIGKGRVEIVLVKKNLLFSEFALENSDLKNGKKPIAYSH